MTHYIRTVHTDFTSRVAPPYAGSSSAAHARILINLEGLISTPSSKYPPGLYNTPSYTRRTTRRAPPRVSTPPLKFDPFADELDSYGPVYVPSYSPSHSQHHSHDVLYRTPRSSPASLSTSSSFTPPQVKVKSYTRTVPAISVPQPLPQPHPQPQRHQQQVDPNARSRLVAGILLNRVHAVGKPMRRRSFDTDTPREYVKSGLSRVVSVEA